MSAKRFVAADMRRALELVKKEMGADAVILSSKRVKNGVEVISSNDPYLNGAAISDSGDVSKRDQSVVDMHQTSPRFNPAQSMQRFRSKENVSAHDDLSPMPSDMAWGSEPVVSQLMHKHVETENLKNRTESSGFNKAATPTNGEKLSSINKPSPEVQQEILDKSRDIAFKQALLAQRRQQQVHDTPHEPAENNSGKLPASANSVAEPQKAPASYQYEPTLSLPEENDYSHLKDMVSKSTPRETSYDKPAATKSTAGQKHNTGFFVSDQTNDQVNAWQFKTANDAEEEYFSVGDDALSKTIANELLSLSDYPESQSTREKLFDGELSFGHGSNIQGSKQNISNVVNENSAPISINSRLDSESEEKFNVDNSIIENIDIEDDELELSNSSEFEENDSSEQEITLSDAQALSLSGLSWQYSSEKLAVAFEINEENSADKNDTVDDDYVNPLADGEKLDSQSDPSMDVEMAVEEVESLSDEELADNVVTEFSALKALQEDAQLIADLRFDQLKDEISGMRAILQSQLEKLVEGREINREVDHKDLTVQQQNSPEEKSTTVATVSPVQQKIKRRFQCMGLSVAVAEKAMRNIDCDMDLESAWAKVLGELSQLMEMSNVDVLAKGGRFAIVGEKGSGKTTLISQLASHQVLTKGGNSVAIVAPVEDPVAVNRLKRIGSILGVPVVQSSEKTLPAVLRSLEKYPLVLIDTIAPIKLPESVATLLTINADESDSNIQSNFELHSSSNIRGCFINRLENSRSSGVVLDNICSRDIPLMGVADSAELTNSLHAIKSHHLISHAVAAMRFRVNNVYSREAGCIDKPALNESSRDPLETKKDGLQKESLIAI